MLRGSVRGTLQAGRHLFGSAPHVHSLQRVLKRGDLPRGVHLRGGELGPGAAVRPADTTRWRLGAPFISPPT